MKGARRLAAAVAVVCQRELIYALILQRNGGQGWERRDRETQWRAYLSDEMLELMDAATASGAWTPDVDGSGILDRVEALTGYFRWISPAGRTGSAHLDDTDARHAAVREASGRTGAEPVGLDPGQIAVLWRGLERSGWRIETVSPVECAKR